MTILPELVVYFWNVSIRKAEVLTFKARVSFLVLEYQVKIQREKTSQLPISMYSFHEYSTFSIHLLLYTAALDEILLIFYPVDLKESSYKTNLTEDIPVVFMNLNTNRYIFTKH
jgi:hypothetical protein